MPITSGSQEIPLEIVGSSTFGRYPTVSSSRTYNMFISTADDNREAWLINFAGYSAIKTLVEAEIPGRGIFHSIRGGFTIAVVGTQVFRINSISGTTPAVLLGSLTTSTGEVSIDENLASQICIVDGTNAYIYNYTSGASPSFGTAVFSDSPTATDFVPNYVTYQNTFFVFGNGSQNPNGSQWRVYAAASNTDLTAQVTLALETKPDYAIAALRIPGAGNNLIVFGTNVAEIWTQIPNLNTYQRNQGINIDYGCISVSTIGSSDNMVAWLSVNEKSSPAIMVMSGGQARRISTDGIDFLMDSIQFPEQSTGFFFRQDGHLFYQLTFFNSADNLTIAYDFTTEKFFDLTDWDFNYHPARQIAYVDGDLYFVSLNDGKLYETGSDLTQYSSFPGLINYDIPRIRTSNTFRLPTPGEFKVNLLTFWVESGTTSGVNDVTQCTGYILDEVTGLPIYDEDDTPLLVEGGECHIYKPRVDVKISKNAGITWSNTVAYEMHNTGNFSAQPRFSQLGSCNQFTVQMRYWNTGRVVVKNAMIEVSK